MSSVNPLNPSQIPITPFVPQVSAQVLKEMEQVQVNQQLAAQTQGYEEDAIQKIKKTPPPPTPMQAYSDDQ